jgi:hypothetical protein
MKKVMIGTPCYDGSLELTHVQSLFHTVDLCRDLGITVTMEYVVGNSLIQTARNQLFRRAIEDNVDDLIFIDGDHKFDGIFVDFFFSDFLIKQNGFILLHDSWMRSTQIVTRFVKTNRKDYVQIRSPEKNIIIFQKNGLDARDGMHFKEFFSFKNIISYNMREALNRNPELKKIIKKIKK